MSLAQEIKRELGLQPQLVKGANGVLDVLADGVLVFSKHRDARFPAPGELAKTLRAASARGR